MSQIKFDQVSKRFLPSNDGLEEISLTLESGEFLLLVGPSGAGKTTLLKLLIREYRPTSGQIFFNETELSQIKTRQLPSYRRKIGVVYQDYRLIPERSVQENIALPLQIAGANTSTIRQRVNDLLTLVQMSEKASLFPSQLSGGEAQRVSIARALALSPDLIFADEPTGNLDLETSLLIAKLLAKINQLGTSLIFATHDQALIDLFKKERKIVLDRGKIKVDSPRSKIGKKSKSAHD